MARFDVYRFPGKGSPLVVDVQADLLSELTTRVVVPLELKSAAGREALARLKPVFAIAGRDYVFKPTDITVLPAHVLQNPIANLESEYRGEIVGALDFLFQGF